MILLFCSPHQTSTCASRPLGAGQPRLLPPLYCWLPRGTTCGTVIALYQHHMRVPVCVLAIFHRGKLWFNEHTATDELRATFRSNDEFCWKWIIIFQITFLRDFLIIFFLIKHWKFVKNSQKTKKTQSTCLWPEKRVFRTYDELVEIEKCFPAFGSKEISAWIPILRRIC